MTWNASNKSPRRAGPIRKNPVLLYYQGHDVEITLEEFPPDEDMPPEWFQNFRLRIKMGSLELFMNITDFTAQELELIGDALNLALELATPIASVRDAIVKEAVDGGDYSYRRQYRGVPSLLVPTGVLAQHLARVRRRREVVLPGQQASGAGPERPVESGGGLDQQPSSGVGGEDDAAQAD